MRKTKNSKPKSFTTLMVNPIAPRVIFIGADGTESTRMLSDTITTVYDENNITNTLMFSGASGLVVTNGSQLYPVITTRTVSAIPSADGLTLNELQTRFNLLLSTIQGITA